MLNLFKSSEKSLRNQWAKKVLFVSILLILFLTLLPFEFENPKENYIQTIATSFEIYTERFDLFGNILLFIPFGFALAGFLEDRRLNFIKIAISVTIASCLLSVTVETLQVFLPERSSNSIDILSNTTSGFTGFLIFYFWGGNIVKVIFWILKVSKRWLNIKWAIAIFLGYLIAICFLLFSFQDATQLSNWDNRYPLLVGNEVTADRPWKGQVSQFCIADRAASKTEVSQLLNDRNSCDAISQSLLASYQFDGNRQRYSDLTKTLPDLISQGNLTQKTTSQDLGVLLDGQHWLQTTESVKLITEKVQVRSQLTLVSTLATADTNQEGPARIISLSQNVSSRNFTLGQEKDELSFRLRTPLTKENGAHPESLVPNVFADTQFHRVAIVYDGWTVKIYVDRPRNLYQFQLSPDAALFWSVMSFFDTTVYLNPLSIFVYKVLYYGILFVPLGWLFAIVWVSYRGNLIFSLLTIGCGILLPALLIEGTISSCMERSWQIGNISLGIVLESIAFLVTHNELAAWWRSTVDYT